MIEQLRDAIAATAVDPASLCADAQRGGLQRIADTLDAVPYVTMCNLSNINAAMRGGLLSMIEVQLMCVGAGPTQDYAEPPALSSHEVSLDRVAGRRGPFLFFGLSRFGLSAVSGEAASSGKL